jgi:hypothetical protein
MGRSTWGCLKLHYVVLLSATGLYLTCTMLRTDKKFPHIVSNLGRDLDYLGDDYLCLIKKLSTLRVMHAKAVAWCTIVLGPGLSSMPLTDVLVTRLANFFASLIKDTFVALSNWRLLALP